MREATPLARESQTSAGRGIFWMVITGFCFVAVTALVKLMGTRIPAVESAFLRYILGLIFLIPMWRALMTVQLTGTLWRLFVSRGLAHAVGVSCWFFAMTRIPIAEVTAMNYLNPVFVTILAVFVLHETLAARRLLAIAAALGGALLILRPGFREIDVGHLAMLGTAVFFAASYLIAKILSGKVNAAVVVAMLSLMVPVVLAPAAIAVWVWPTAWELAVLTGVALFATAGHYTMTLAFAAAPVTLTQPVLFLQLVWSVAIGALFFAEPVDPWVIAGGTLILAAVVFITWRESVLKRHVTPSVTETKQ